MEKGEYLVQIKFQSHWFISHENECCLAASELTVNYCVIEMKLITY